MFAITFSLCVSCTRAIFILFFAYVFVYNVRSALYVMYVFLDAKSVVI